MVSRAKLLCAVVFLTLFAAACGGGGQQDVVDDTTREPRPTDTATDDGKDDDDDDDGDAAGGVITSVDDVQMATVQIVAQGAFRDPEFGEYEGAGAGSGFIIDPEGIAVTNNHVVTGAASLNVFVAGGDDPVNARVLGVSECSDLAVIDLDGSDYPYLEWYEDEPSTRLDVFAAGFPLGAPEFTLTDGIINVPDRDIETVWASVENVIEHSARIRPGNSGGPLVTEEAQVVGVNYAGSDLTDQNLAINVNEAERLVEQLRDEEDVTSIGVNGFAIDDGAGNTGVWVTSVASGSPSDIVGLAGGDIITRLEGITLAQDGTMADYCDVLRSHSASDVLDIEVLRYDTQEFLEGQLNGDELVQSVSFAQELEDTVEEGTGGEATYSDYTTISDDTGAIQVAVPVEWSDVDGRPYTDDAGNNIADVRASASLDNFHSTWEEPGMIFSASTDLAQSGNEETLLNELVDPLSGQCTYQGRSPYQDPAYTGVFDVYTDCGGVGATYVVVGAVPEDRRFVIRVQIQANTDRDFDALDQILATFVVTGQV